MTKCKAKASLDQWPYSRGCKRNQIEGSDFCWQHDPERIRQRREEEREKEARLAQAASRRVAINNNPSKILHLLDKEGTLERLVGAVSSNYDKDTVETVVNLLSKMKNDYTIAETLLDYKATPAEIASARMKLLEN